MAVPEASCRAGSAAHQKTPATPKTAPRFSAVQLPGSGALPGYAVQSLTSMDPYQRVMRLQLRPGVITYAFGAVGLKLSGVNGDVISEVSGTRLEDLGNLAAPETGSPTRTAQVRTATRLDAAAAAGCEGFPACGWIRFQATDLHM